MKTAFFVLILSLITVCLFLSFGRYRSAFEADQACHYERWKEYGETPGYDCDHDLETNQWILYQKGINDKPSQVVERYRY